MWTILAQFSKCKDEYEAKVNFYANFYVFLLECIEHFSSKLIKK